MGYPMTGGSLGNIKQAEKKALEKIQSAKEDSEKTILNAKKQAEKEKIKIIQNAKKKTEEQVKKTSEKAKKETIKIKQDGKKEITRIQKESEKNISDAVDLIIKEIEKGE